MMSGPDAELEQALAVSCELLAAAEQGNLEAMARLDAERMRLLQSVRPKRDRLSSGDRQMIAEIARLNDQSIGSVEHHRRIKQRALETAAVGRRAVVAYATNRSQR